MQNLKELIPFSKSLTALYVEDDNDIRDNYAKVFTEIFQALDVAVDGQEGLQKFQTGSYDIIITDINMPRMNGIEMIRKIFEKDDEQVVIVTSAHDEAQYLLQLIELGIEKFLIKPVDFSKMITVLYRTCKRLIEQRELREYQGRIEEENLRTAALLKELQNKNEELEKEIKKKTQKENVNMTLVDGIEKEKTFTEEQLDFFSPKVGAISAADFVAHFTGDVETLNDKLEAIEETLELSIHQKLSSPTQESVDELAVAFKDYATLLDSTMKYGNLAEALRHLSSVLAQVETLSLLTEMKPFLFGIADSLQKLRTEVLVERSTQDIHYLDQSIISDCLQTESMLIEDTPAEGDLDDLFF